jgi:hypothetical protein
MHHSTPQALPAESCSPPVREERWEVGREGPAWGGVMAPDATAAATAAALKMPSTPSSWMAPAGRLDPVHDSFGF